VQHKGRSSGFAGDASRNRWGRGCKAAREREREERAGVRARRLPGRCAVEPPTIDAGGTKHLAIKLAVDLEQQRCGRAQNSMKPKKMKLLRTICVVVVLALVPFAAGATMPRLDEMPPVRTDEACWAWASEQIYHEDVAIMWGVLDDGNYDPAVAVRRLADVCLGREQPEIVGFGSSAGYYRTYCQNHPRQKICLIKNLEPRCVGNPGLCAQVCKRGGWCP
jgi:hypothetical protein